MNKFNYGFMVLLLGFLWLGCSGSDETKTVAEEKALPVRGMTINPVSMDLNKTFTGTLEGEKQAVIRAKINEAVEGIDVVEGDEVAMNSVLVRLDKTGPTSSYLQTKSYFQNAEKNFKKMEYLYNEGAISETQFDGAKTEYEVAKANYEAARQLVELSTPIAGTVTSIAPSVGDYVSAGQQVATVATIDKLRMKLGVNATDIGFFHVGDTVKILVESNNGTYAIGTVSMVARSADPDTRTFQVEIEINNKDHSFKPGMFARAEVGIARFENILAAPRQAILTRNDKQYIYVIRDNRALAKEVELGTEFSGSVEIKSGLTAADTIVTLGQDYLGDNSLIKLTEIVNATAEETSH